MVRLPEKKKPTAIDQHMPSISQTAPVDMTNRESLKRAGGSGGGGGGRQPKRSKFEPDNGIDDAVKPGDIRWTVPRYLPPLVSDPISHPQQTIINCSG